MVVVTASFPLCVPFEMIEQTVAVAADHAGLALKETLKQELAEMGFAVLDLGTDGPDSVDYPDYADAVARAIGAGEAHKGLLLCGTGIGMSIAANRHPGIRAALCHDVETARLARAHNDANVLVLGGRVLTPDGARACVRTFFSTEFAGGRHRRRLSKIG